MMNIRTDESEELTCRRCALPVRVGRDHYDTFEQMHYVCFHYEFEHRIAVPDGDPDEDCGVAGCPSSAQERQNDQLVAAVRELLAEWSDGPPANWDNHQLPDYLRTFAARLEEAEAYYVKRGVPGPVNGWQAVAQALREATAYE
ncbi:hypothetical protein D5S17_22685 [Pseudonocardiaceae bacterium YIM PH 21723]|nr:hypothetical protein D5S17_22685 [Pseudonocardiaceae bacterium YIM PH 21723]